MIVLDHGYMHTCQPVNCRFLLSLEREMKEKKEITMKECDYFKKFQ